tara:strand:+ start:3778 stop:4620 length:843 start_codon:yes stop_codon:yes gene_type:complete
MTKRAVTLPQGNIVTYWTHHTDKRPTLILVHGFTGSHEGFQYLVPLLQEFRLIIPDLPGFGVSPLPHHTLSLAELGEQLASFIQSLNLSQPPHVIGHSMGSLVVCEAIKQHPELFAHKLILVSPVPSPVSLLDSRKLGVIASRLYYIASHRLPYIGRRLATSKKITKLSTKLIMTARDKKLQQAIHEHHFTNLNYISSIGWYAHLHKEINNTGITQYSSTLKAFDVLIINGEKDVVTPLKHQQKAAATVQAKIITIPKVGHLSHYEKPTQLATAIVDFLR